MHLGRIGDKHACQVVASRNPTRFIHGVGDTREAALEQLAEKLAEELGCEETYDLARGD